MGQQDVSIIRDVCGFVLLAAKEVLTDEILSRWRITNHKAFDEYIIKEVQRLGGDRIWQALLASSMGLYRAFEFERRRI